MTLFLLLLASAMAATCVALVAGFRLGRRYRTPAPENCGNHPSQAPECQSVVDERGLPTVAEAVIPPREPLPQSIIPEVSLAKLAADGKVMIVDDEPINIKVVQKFLKLGGYQHIVGVTDPRTVLSRIAADQPDLVLLDIMMPEVSGMELLEQIRAMGEWAYLPVIMVTASDNEETKVQALDLGATDFLGKPVNSTELIPRVRNALLVKANHDYLKHYAKELERQTRQLESQIAQARTDVLTGLANRRALDEELARRSSELQRTGSPLSVMLLDVDHFKRFNDTHGHRAGDEALRIVAAVLRGAMRQMDVVTRYGGEEFLVILPSTDIDCATMVAERTRQDIGKTVFRYDGKDLSLTVSIGVAQFASNEHMTRMLERVDRAMYASKEAGRNRTYWHDGRATHPACEEPAALQPAEPSRATPLWKETGPEPPTPPALAPASRETQAAGQESPELAGYLCDRTAFLWHVRQRIAEWKRGGSAFCVLLVQVQEDQHAAETSSREARDSMPHPTSRILTTVLREMDLIGRYDDACFGLLLPRTTLQDGLNVAERVRQSVGVGDSVVNCAPVGIALTVGVAEVAEGDDVVRLIQRANAAMSQAEKAGVGCCPGQWADSLQSVAKSPTLELCTALSATGLGDAVPVA